jgi:gamma-glutamyl hercynylcysteine S-oxide synthase
MATTQTATLLHPTLLARLDEARARTDSFFELLPPNSFYERPVPERHRLIFYLGHLEAFDWNLLSGEFGLVSQQAALDKLFAFGIDPVGGGLPSDTPADWPSVGEVEEYNRQVRDRLDDALRRSRPARPADSPFTDETLLHVAIEHRLMHAETLAYLLHNLSLERSLPPSLSTTIPRLLFRCRSSFQLALLRWASLVVLMRSAGTTSSMQNRSTSRHSRSTLSR